jgi:RHS repeat-associated protein
MRAAGVRRGVASLIVVSLLALVPAPLGLAADAPVEPFVPGSPWDVLAELGLDAPNEFAPARADGGGDEVVVPATVGPEDGVVLPGDVKVDLSVGPDGKPLPGDLPDGDLLAPEDAAGKVSDPGPGPVVEPGVIDALTTESSRTVQNADGTRTLELAAGVERVKDAAGEWVELDESPVAAPGGGFVPVQALTELSVAADADAAAVATVGLGGGELVVSYPGAAKVAGAVAGDAVVYAGALDGRDLRLEFVPAGVKESVVAKDATVASSYLVELVLPDGVSARQAGGSIEFVDAAGVVVGGYAGGHAYDSGEQSEAGLSLVGVDVTLVSVEGATATVLVSVDAKWWAAPERVFPVTIDPYSYTIVAGQGSGQFNYGDQFIKQGQTTAAQYWTHGDLIVGGDPDYHSEIRFNLGALVGEGRIRIEEADLQLWNEVSGSCSTTSAKKVQLLGIATWEASTATWANQSDLHSQPLISETGFANGLSCGPAAWVDLDATQLVQFWANQSGVAGITHWANAGIALWPKTANYPEGLRVFDSVNGPNNPKLSITYEPLAVSYGPARSWQREAGIPQSFDVWVHNDLIDPGLTQSNWTEGGQKLSVKLWAGPYVIEQLVEIPDACGPSISPGEWCKFSFTLSQTLPGQYALTYDLKDLSPTASEEGWQYASAYGSPVRTDVLQLSPVAHFGQDPYAAHAQSVNTFSGSYAMQYRDFSIPGPGPALELVRTYNSGDHLQFDYNLDGTNDFGPFGEGWHFNYETRLIPGFLGATIVMPDGRWEYHGANGTATYTPPPGYDGTLTWVSAYAVFVFSDHRKMNYIFDAAGKLLFITDKNGNRLQLTYHSSDKVLIKVEKILTNNAGQDVPTGRWLEFSWNAANTRIVQVKTSPYAGSSTLQWNYSYNATNSTRLVEACDPRSNATIEYCTDYGYTSVAGAGPNHANAFQLETIERPDGDRYRRIEYYADGATTEVRAGRVRYVYDGPALAAYPNYPGTPTPVPPRWAYTYDWTTPTSGSGENVYLVANVDDARSNKVAHKYDPDGKLVFFYHDYNPATQLFALERAYFYDNGPTGRGFLEKTRDEAGAWVVYTTDEHGNVTQTKTQKNCLGTPADCDDPDDPQSLIDWITETWTYNANNQPLTYHDGRASGPGGDDDLTTYGYDPQGNKNLQEWPNITYASTALHRAWNYTNGLENAVGGGDAPKGLLKHDKDGKDNFDHYEYTSIGNLARITTRAGAVTTFVYDSLGRETSRTVTCADCTISAGQTTTTTYNGLSQVLTVTEPRSYDVQDADPDHWHQRRTTNSYDTNANLASVTISDLNTTGYGDDPRVTSYEYNENNVEQAVNEPAVDYQGTLTVPRLERSFDNNGNITQVIDQQGRVFKTTYDHMDRPLRQILRNYDQDPRVTTDPIYDLIISETVYDVVGRPVYVVDALGSLAPSPEAGYRVTKHRYYDNGWEKETWLLNYRADGSTPATADVKLVEYDYDGAGNITRTTTGDGILVSDTVYDTANRAVKTIGDSDAGPGTANLNATVELTLDENGNVTKRRSYRGTASPWEETRYVYNDNDQPLEQVVEMNSSNGTQYGTDLVTFHAYDQLGNLKHTISPRGQAATDTTYRTSYQTDELRRTVITNLPTAPATTIDPATGTVSTDPSPVVRTETAYDTFGNITKTEDPDNHVTTNLYDALDRRTRIVWPAYTRPSGQTAQTPGCATNTVCERFEYDPAGNLIRQIDRHGQTYSYSVDQLNRPYRETMPAAPQLEGGSVTTASPVVDHYYDAVGNEAGTITAAGAITLRIFDDRNQLHENHAVVRATAIDPNQVNTTSYTYDALGRPYLTQGSNGQLAITVYNPLGEIDQQLPCYCADATSYTYDLAGRIKRTTEPGGRYTEQSYDQAGRPTRLQQYSASGVLLATRQSGYDLDSNPTALWTPNGYAANPQYNTGMIYDPQGRLTLVAEPQAAGVIAYTSYDYDRNNNLTRITDPNTNQTLLDYNTWNLEETRIEPATSGQATIAHRAFTASYDNAGLVARYDQPTGNPASPARLDYSYDPLGRLETITGSGAEAATATKTYAYDRGSRQVRTNSPTGTGNLDIEYTDLDQPARVLGPASGAGDDTSYSYDPTGRLTTRTDSAGTANFGYDTRNRLTAATDPLSGAALIYTWGPDDRLQQIDYSTGPRRVFSYDTTGRLATDRTYATASQATLRYELIYDYDPNNNITTKTIGPAAVAAAGAHTYSYDLADRLTRWEAPGNQITDYAYDPAGNRTRNGTLRYRYDERNRLCYQHTTNTNACSSPPAGATTYSWSPRGTLTNNAGTTASYDAYGRTITHGSISYAYDGYDRVATRNTTTFTYEGLNPDPIGDGTNTISHLPSGEPFGHRTGTANRLALTDQRGDLTGLLSATGTSLTESFAYTPYGEPDTQTGTIDPNIGYQADYTDPTNNQVWMGARWYQPTTDTFTTRDSYGGDTRTPVSLNRYTYARNNPINYSDPTGHEFAPNNQTAGDEAVRRYLCWIGAANGDTNTNFYEQNCHKSIITESNAGTVTEDPVANDPVTNDFEEPTSTAPATTPVIELHNGELTIVEYADADPLLAIMRSWEACRMGFSPGILGSADPNSDAYIEFVATLDTIDRMCAAYEQAGLGVYPDTYSTDFDLAAVLRGAGEMVINFVPVVGDVYDGYLCISSTVSGDRGDAAINCAATIPIIGAGGDAAQSAKIIGRSIESASDAQHTTRAATNNVDDVLRLGTKDSWGNLNTLDDHFARHGADFGATSADDYARQASEFLQQPGTLTKIDPKTGVIRVYDPATEAFGAYNPTGTTRTFYIPDPAKHGYPTNLAYWNAQPG